jgi:hypothetical protein
MFDSSHQIVFGFSKMRCSLEIVYDPSGNDIKYTQSN